MSLAYDLYQPGRSALHRADPRAKLLAVICASGCLLATQNLWLIVLALAAIHGLLLAAGIRRERVAWVWRMTLPTVALIAVLWALLNPAQEGCLISWWFVRLSAFNVAQGLAIGLRIAALAFVVLGWLFTTDQSALVLGLVALGLPYAWGLTIAMALRYLPTMAGVFRTISEAQQARALDLTQGGPFRRARAYIPITVAMLITALRTAQHLSYALESRALGALPQRTYLHQLRFRPLDAAYTATIALLTAAFVWARLAHGLGAHPLSLLG
jgi:energy-coupling factor transport system permease protein